jgi:hypothetical protein
MTREGRKWCTALGGLSLLVFAVVALSSAGRIDVVDGHTRYEVGRSFVEHGDSIVRNADAWFAVFPGRNGERYTNYRFPQSVVAAAAIVASDASGPVTESRRHFFFALSGAVLCALMACLYAYWFRKQGQGFSASIGWAAAGIFCTPTWFYGATTFDDVLGTLVVLAAICVANNGRRPNAEGRISVSAFCLRPSALISGLLLGLAFNCKPPLALFMPAVIAALWDPKQKSDERWLQTRIVFFCTAIGVIGYELYDLWKFPPSTWKALAEARSEYLNLWPGSPLVGVLSLLISPGMGAIWYWPPLFIALYGLIASCRSPSPQPQAPSPSSATGPTTDARQLVRRFVERVGSQPNGQLALMVAVSSLAFLCFIGSIRFFSGEPAWGPRYLTPVFAVLWLFMPAGVTRLRWPKAAALLAVSFVVQVAGLTIEPMRFFSGDNVAAAEGFLREPWTYFRFDRSQLLARPRQLWEVLTYDGPPATAFTPAKAPTLPLIIYVKTDKRMEARDYQVLSTLRPWWISFRPLSVDTRPVDLSQAVELLLLMGAIGLAMLGLAFFSCRQWLTTSVVDNTQHGRLSLRERT